MITWQLMLVDALRRSNDDDGCKLAELVGQAANRLGYDCYTYGLWLSLPLSNPQIKWTGNTPLAWRNRYCRMNYVRHDPVVLHTRFSCDPLLWTDSIYAATPALQKDARDHGQRDGWSQACINSNGTRGMLTLSRAMPALVSETSEKADDLRWFSSTVHLFLSQVGCEHTATSIKLTDREINVLRWTGDGKTSAEISTILGISLNTVNFHLKNAIYKLRATNKTSAVVLALVHGLLKS
jgi:LuxR family transcriptional regulator, quorum-sensing system regulator SolR